MCHGEGGGDIIFNVSMSFVVISSFLVSLFRYCLTFDLTFNTSLYKTHEQRRGVILLKFTYKVESAVLSYPLLHHLLNLVYTCTFDSGSLVSASGMEFVAVLVVLNESSLFSWLHTLKKV